MLKLRRHRGIVSDRWRDEHRRDPYARKARAEGYRSRSAFKLLQIQERFGLIRKGDAVLDVGCHPGGWSQVASELVGDEGDIIGIDLRYTTPLPNCRFHEMDAADPQAPEMLQAHFGRPVNTVISDISPNLTGRYEMDVVNSVHLSVMALDLALRLLCDGGNVVTKLFVGEGVEAVMGAIKPRFSKLQRFEPEASRNASSEVYIVARNRIPSLAENLPSIADIVLPTLAGKGSDVEADVEPVVGLRRLTRDSGVREEL